jgi:hypothetical protein
MVAIYSNPEMEDISVPGSQNRLLLQRDRESKLKFQYFIVPQLTAKRAG